MVVLLLAAAGVTVPAPARAQSGTVDPTFGVGGIVVAPVGSGDDFGYAAALQADDRIVVAGTCAAPNDDFCLARFNLDGTLDTTLNGTGKLTTAIRSEIDRAFAVAIQPSDQRIVLAGFSRESANDDFALARLNADGSPDTAFDGDGKVTTAVGSLGDQALAVAVQGDGRIVAAGYSLARNRNLALVRYEGDGSLDTSFGGDGKVAVGIGTGNDEAYGVAVQGDGKIVVAGYAANGSHQDMLVARFTAAGALDASFGGGTGFTRITFGTGSEYGQALAIQSDGKILVAGYARIGMVFEFAIARVDQSGALDPTFGTGGKVLTPIGSRAQARAIDLANGGRFMVAGVARISGNHDFAVARYNSDGSLDTLFGGTGVVTTPIGTAADDGYAVAMQRDRKIVVAGTARSGNDRNLALARYLVSDCGNGTLDEGEACDGGASIAGDCCTTLCRVVAAGTVCRAAVDGCDLVEACDGASGACPADAKLPDGDADGVCDLIDICPVDPDPLQRDGDDDGLGDKCDPCTNGVEVARASLRLKGFDTAAGDDSIQFTGQLDFPAPPTLAPTNRGARLIVTQTDGTPLFDVTVPAGAYSAAARRGWTVNASGTSHTFRSSPAFDGVVQKLKLSAAAASPQLVKFSVSGRSGSYATSPLALPLEATVVLDPPTAETGECGAATFPGPAPAPACAYNATGSTLSCR